MVQYIYTTKLCLSVYALCFNAHVCNIYILGICGLLFTINEKHMSATLAVITYWKHGVVITMRSKDLSALQAFWIPHDSGRYGH